MEKVAIPKLNANNWSSWKFSAELLLVRENLWKYVSKERPSEVPATRRNAATDGENAAAVAQIPANAAELEAWDSGDQRARATIGLLMEPSLHALIKKTTSAREAWTKLKEHFEDLSLTMDVVHLRGLIAKRYHEGDNMEKHVSEMEEVFEKLADGGMPIPTRLQLALVFCSVPKSFSGLTSALETRADLTLAMAKTKLIDEVTKQGSFSEGESVLKAGSSKRVIVCHYCEKPGHKQKDCRKRASELKTDNKIDQHIRKNPPRAKAVREEPFGNRAFSMKGTGETGSWIIDSGASSHMCADPDAFLEMDDTHYEDITLADGSTTPAKGKGTCLVHCCDLEGKRCTMTLSDTLLVPKLDTNLISVRKLVTKGGTVIFDTRGGRIMDGNEVAAVASACGGLYYIKNAHNARKMEVKTHTQNCQHSWHRKMGHRDNDAVQKLFKQKLATGIKIEDCGIRTECECCLEGKFVRLPFPKKAEMRSRMPLDLIHVDVCGPMPVATPVGSRYFLTIIDDFSRYTTVCFLREKSDVGEKLRDFVMEAKTTFGRPPKVIRSDNGGEFKNKTLERFFKQEGIRQQFTTPHTPQQNGVAERKNRSLNEMATCMLLDAGLPKKYWAEAVNTANYLQNRLPTKILETTPYEAWFGDKPDVSHLQVFGADAYVWIPKQNRKKFDATAQKMTFVGYSMQQKAYRFLDRSNGYVINSRDARFLPTTNFQDEGGDDGSIIEYHFPSDDGFQTNTIPIVAGDVHGEPADDEEGIAPNADDSEDQNDTATELHDDTTLTNDTNERPLNAPGPSATSTPLRVSSRVNKGVPPPRFPAVSNHANQQSDEPRTLAEAQASPEWDQWKMAMDEEYGSLQENSTWDIVNLPGNRKPVGCRWIFKKKLDERGNVVRYKARLVAQGFSQKFGTDYDEVYAPVAKHTTFRALLSVAARRRMQVKHVDIKTAYLYGEISETIYMRQPPGYETGNPADVCHLRRSLYGLKQAGRVWNRTITDVMKQLGYNATEADSCLFVRDDGGLSFILLYVDDILIVTNNNKEYERVRKHLEKKFKLSCLGDVKNYLGIHVERQDDGSFLLNQENYIERMLTKFGLEQARPSPIPMDPGYVTAEQKEEKVMATTEKYQSLVGALLYIAVCTRPDMAITASILGRKVSKPTETDWTEAKRALRYLKGTAGLKLLLGGIGDLQGYADADWAGDRTDRKSNSGFLFKLGDGTISWTARKQQCVTLSSTEAEYVSLAEACKELLWLLKLMKGLGEDIHQPVIIHEDNQSCMSILAAEGDSRRTKHIDTRYNFVRDLARSGTIGVKYCPTEEMLADLLTKPLNRIKLQTLRERTGLHMIDLEEEC